MPGKYLTLKGGITVAGNEQYNNRSTLVHGNTTSNRLEVAPVHQFDGWDANGCQNTQEGFGRQHTEHTIPYL